MGPKLDKPEQPKDYTSKIQESEMLLNIRKKKRNILSTMVKRVLTSPKPNFSADLSRLPESSILLILEFIPNDIKVLLSVSAFWHFSLTEAIDHAFNSIESGFAIMHSHLITFKKSYLYIKEIRASGKCGYRIDRILVAEILPILKNYTVKFRYTYKYYKSETPFSAEFKIDCCDKGKRSVWCHRDESKFHGADRVRAYCQQIPSICIGDNIELAINWFSLFGLLRRDCITWQPPILCSMKNYLRSLKPKTIDQEEYSKKKTHLYKISRNCEPEVNCSEWYDIKYYPAHPQANPYDHFLPFLKLVKFEFTGSEIIVSKSTFKAEKCGIVPDSMSYIGIWVEIVEEGADIKQEVKRMGLLYDRHVPVRLRIGDELVVYISRGG